MRPFHLVYVLANPLSPRDYERFGMKFFLDGGARITALDIADLVHPSLRFDRQKFQPNPRVTVRAIESVRRLADEQNTFRSAALVIFVAQSHGPDSLNLAALRAIRRCRRPYLIFGMGVVPRAADPKRRSDIVERLRGSNFRLEWRSILDRAIRRLPLWMLNLAHADFIVHDGRSSVRFNPLVGPKTNRIFAHSFDYENARPLLTTAPCRTGTAVFLDQFIPYHQDFVAQGLSRHLDPTPYHAALRRLFDQIERDLGLRVVVAAHPRADYAGLDVFGERPILHGRTVELVRDSSLVIAHSSTAASHAAIFRRPILIVATREMLDLNLVFSSQIRGVAQALGVPLRLISPDSDADLAQVPAVNENLYAAYIEHYVKVSSSPDDALWRIVVDSVANKGFLERPTPRLKAVAC